MTRTSLIADVDGATPPEDKGPRETHLEDKTNHRDRLRNPMSKEGVMSHRDEVSVSS